MSRQRKFLVVGVFVLALAALGAGGYLFFYGRDSAPNAKSGGEVAAARDGRVMPESWLLKYFGTADAGDAKVNGADGDPDEDLLSNYREYLFQTDPTKDDSDGDGFIDSYEIAFNRNPNGEGNLPTKVRENYVRDFIAANEEFQDFSEQKIQQRVNSLVRPDRAVVMDLPPDAELVISPDNSVAALQRYYDDVKGLTVADADELKKLRNNLLGLSLAELDEFQTKLVTTIDLLKQVPVPSEIVNIHRLKIAELRAGVKIFEMIRSANGAGFSDEQWSDLLYQTIVAQNAQALQLVAWREVGLILENQGGLSELENQ